MSADIIWMPVKGYEGKYDVSNTGFVRSLKQKYGERKIPILLKPALSRDGYLRVVLSDKNMRKNKSVHRIVAEAFIENAFNRPCVNHIDGIKTNNMPENLEWCSDLENHHHAAIHGLTCRGERNAKTNLSSKDVLTIRSMYGDGNHSQRDLAFIYRISQFSIWSILSRKTWRHI